MEMYRERTVRNYKQFIKSKAEREYYGDSLHERGKPSFDKNKLHRTYESQGSEMSKNDRFKNILYPRESRRLMMKKEKMEVKDIPGTQPKASPNFKRKEMEEIEGTHPKAMRAFHGERNLILDVADINGKRKYEYKGKMDHSQSFMLSSEGTEKPYSQYLLSKKPPMSSISKDPVSHISSFEKNQARFYGEEPPLSKHVTRVPPSKRITGSNYSIRKDSEKQPCLPEERIKGLSRRMAGSQSLNKAYDPQAEISGSKHCVNSDYYVPQSKYSSYSRQGIQDKPTRDNPSSKEKAQTPLRSSAQHILSNGPVESSSLDYQIQQPKKINPTYISQIPLGTQNTTEKRIIFNPNFELFKKSLQ